MKLKLLVVPSIIAAVIIMGIWLIYPAYYNGTDGLKDRYDQLGKEKTKLEAIQGRSVNVDTLSNQLDALSSDKDALYGFIPENIKEAEIIKTLSQMASDAGVLVYNVSLGKPAYDKTEAPQFDTMGATSLDGNATDGSADAGTVGTLPVPKNFETSVEISGNYFQIKEFLKKLNDFSRYNEVTSVLVVKNTTPENGQEDGAIPSDILRADLKMNFNILGKAVLSDGTTSDAVFSNSTLDTKIISQIREQRVLNAIHPEIGQQGRENPFVK